MSIPIQNENGKGRGPFFGRKINWSEQSLAFTLLAPALFVFAVFGWYPIARTVISSFQNVRLAGGSEFVGLINYRRMLGDPLFYQAWKNSIEFVFWGLLLGFLLPLVLAILVNEMRRLTGFFRLIYWLPNVIPITVAAVIWRFLFNPELIGVLNILLRELGLPTSYFLQNMQLVKPLLVLIATWVGFGSSILIFQSALQEFPPELYEAAELDGASPWQRVRHCTLPYLWPVMRVLLILQILSMGQFVVLPYILTNGGPGLSSTTPPLESLTIAFGLWNYGLAAAWNVSTAVILGVFSVFFFFFRIRKAAA